MHGMVGGCQTRCADDPAHKRCEPPLNVRRRLDAARSCTPRARAGMRPLCAYEVCRRLQHPTVHPFCVRPCVIVVVRARVSNCFAFPLQLWCSHFCHRRVVTMCASESSHTEGHAVPDRSDMLIMLPAKNVIDRNLQCLIKSVATTAPAQARYYRFASLCIAVCEHSRLPVMSTETWCCQGIYLLDRHSPSPSKLQRRCSATASTSIADTPPITQSQVLEALS